MHTTGLAWVVVLVAVVSAGCLGLDGSVTDGERTTTTGGTAMEGATVSNDADASNGRVVRVVDVVDGDTIDVRLQNGTTETVRLLGVDTPEVHAKTNPAEFEGVPDTAAGHRCLRAVGENASAFARRHLADRQVRLVDDSLAANRGSYGRLLAYVYVDGRNFNHRLVASGYARVYDSTFELADRFYDAEASAQAAGRGVWSCRTVG